MLTAPAAVPSVPRAKVERPAERVAVASGSAPAVPNDRAAAAAQALAALMAAGTDNDLRADFDALALRVDALASREPAAVRQREPAKSESPVDRPGPARPAGPDQLSPRRGRPADNRVVEPGSA